MVEVASSGGIFHRSDSEGALCARLVSSFPSSRWEDWRLVHLCCFGGAVTRLLEHSRVQPMSRPGCVLPVELPGREPGVTIAPTQFTLKSELQRHLVSNTNTPEPQLGNSSSAISDGPPRMLNMIASAKFAKAPASSRTPAARSSPLRSVSD